MNFIVVSLGSQGDVHPFIGIAGALRARGHAVTMISFDHFEPAARQLDLEFVAAAPASELARRLEEHDVLSPVGGAKVVKYLMVDTMRAVYDAIARRHIPGKTVLVAFSLVLGARLANERLDIPLVTLHLSPSALRSPKLATRFGSPDLPRWLARLMTRPTMFMTDVLVDVMLGTEVETYRAELGLGPQTRVFRWADSPQRAIGLFPDWFVPPQSAWPPHLTSTHFPLFDAAAAHPVPREIEAFLGAGAAPIVFTPGSPARGFAAFHRASIEACQALGQRGILISRWPEDIPPRLPEGIVHAAYVPFGALLPRVAAFVHHAGIGTLAQALRAGVPQLGVPWGVDQFDNAARLRRLGVAHELALFRYRGRKVADALARLLDDRTLHQTCRDIATRFDGVDTVTPTCEAIEAFAGDAWRVPGR